MNNFDEPVKKAETDAEILDALQGVKLTQDEIRRGACGGMGLAFFRAYYEKLPEEVARRLTEIDTEAVEHITRATGLNLSGSLLDRFGEKLASDAAFAQVIRAANVYRGGWATLPSGRTAGRRWRHERKSAEGGAVCRSGGAAGRGAGDGRDHPGAAVPGQAHQQERPRGAAQAHDPRACLGSQALGAAVQLRQQMEIAEFTRGLIEQQKAAQEPQGGPLPC